MFNCTLHTLQVISGSFNKIKIMHLGVSNDFSYKKKNQHHSNSLTTARTGRICINFRQNRTYTDLGIKQAIVSNKRSGTSRRPHFGEREADLMKAGGGQQRQSLAAVLREAQPHSTAILLFLICRQNLKKCSKTKTPPVQNIKGRCVKICCSELLKGRKQRTFFN